MKARAAAQAPIDGAKPRQIWMMSAAFVSLCWASTVTTRPVQVVSINPCIDAILMEVADPAQIAAITHYSQDFFATSIPLAQAMRFRATSGTAEEVMALVPDLVIVSGHGAPSTVNPLARLHIPLLKLEVPETIAQSLAQIREVAAALGHPERGAASIARIEAALLAERPRDQLEYFNARPLAMLLSASAAVDQQDRMLSHTALERLWQRIAIRHLPFRLLQCAGPTIVSAVTRLAALRRGLPQRAATK